MSGKIEYDSVAATMGADNITNIDFTEVDGKTQFALSVGEAKTAIDNTDETIHISIEYLGEISTNIGRFIKGAIQAMEQADKAAVQ
jgi:hypothetical protein